MGGQRDMAAEFAGKDLFAHLKVRFGKALPHICDLDVAAAHFGKPEKRQGFEKRNELVSGKMLAFREMRKIGAAGIGRRAQYFEKPHQLLDRGVGEAIADANRFRTAALRAALSALAPGDGGEKVINLIDDAA